MSKINLNEVESGLWAMANKLRGNMDASEYKTYIFAFMFYRYLSDKQDNWLVSNGLVQPEEGQSVNEILMEDIFGTSDIDKIKEYAKVSRSFTRMDIEKTRDDGSVVINADGQAEMVPVGSWVENYRDYEQSAVEENGYFISPLYSWSTIEEMIENNRMLPSDYQGMFDAFNASVDLGAKDRQIFKGIFSDVNLGDSRLGTSLNDRAKSLGNIVSLVSTIPYKEEGGKDILGAIYEYLIKMFAASAGKKGGEFYTPHEVSLIMARIVTAGFDPKTAFTVYDPTCGSGSLLLTVGQQLPKRAGSVIYYGQELNTTTYNICRMNLIMNDVSYNQMHLRNANTLGSDWPDGEVNGKDSPRAFDGVVANPPYSAEWLAEESYIKDPRYKKYGRLAPRKKADLAFLLNGFHHLKPEGTMAIVLPHGVLFRGAAEGEIRKRLVQDGSIYAVIGLPANLFYGTGIPTTIIVLKKQRKEFGKDILFIDASQEFEKQKNKNVLTAENVDKIVKTFLERKDVERYAHLASFDEIEKNDYNLNIPRYVDTREPEEEIDLKAVQAEINKVDEEIAELTRQLNDTFRELGIYYGEDI